jgi:hypothetical protein
MAHLLSMLPGYCIESGPLLFDDNGAIKLPFFDFEHSRVVFPEPASQGAIQVHRHPRQTHAED